MGEERRFHARYPLSRIPAISEVALQGMQASVMDISRTGALVEHAGWLAVGRVVRVKVNVSGTSITFKGRTVRARVKRLEKSGVVYEVAVSFDAPPTMLLSALGGLRLSESMCAQLDAEPSSHALCA